MAAWQTHARAHARRRGLAGRRHGRAPIPGRRQLRGRGTAGRAVCRHPDRRMGLRRRRRQRRPRWPMPPRPSARRSRPTAIPALLALAAAAARHGVAFVAGRPPGLGRAGRGCHGLGAATSCRHPRMWTGPSVRDVPVILVTGTNGKSTTVRLIAAMARAAGKVAGLSSSDWVRVGDEILDRGDYSGPGGARLALARSPGRARGAGDRPRRHPASRAAGRSGRGRHRHQHRRRPSGRVRHPGRRGHRRREAGRRQGACTAPAA